jgi:hypothetical protein
MTATTPCSRHLRGVWVPGCPDCTAWHVDIALAHCDQVAAAVTTARTSDRAVRLPDAMTVPPATRQLGA